jgi:hypothetical protein
MASTESKADEDSAFALSRDTNKTGPYYYRETPGAIATIVTRTNIGGTNGSGGAVR